MLIPEKCWYFRETGEEIILREDGGGKYSGNL